MDLSSLFFGGEEAGAELFLVFGLCSPLEELLFFAVLALLTFEFQALLLDAQVAGEVVSTTQADDLGAKLPPGVKLVGWDLGGVEAAQGGGDLGGEGKGEAVGQALGVVLQAGGGLEEAAHGVEGGLFGLPVEEAGIFPSGKVGFGNGLVVEVGG